jgi:hypothetical protein
MPFGATPSRWCVCQFHHFRGVNRPAGLQPKGVPSVYPKPAIARKPYMRLLEVHHRICRSFTLLRAAISWAIACFCLLDSA